MISIDYKIGKQSSCRRALSSALLICSRKIALMASQSQIGLPDIRSGHQSADILRTTALEDPGIIVEIWQLLRQAVDVEI